MVTLLIGATVRLTRLIVADTIMEPIRRRLHGWLGYLAECPWCASVWVGGGVFAAAHFAPDTPVLAVSGALTASLVAGWAQLGEDLLRLKAFEYELRLKASEHERAED